jgi:hypothetical protein
MNAAVELDRLGSKSANETSAFTERNAQSARRLLQ